jgi:hypothetical protein
MTKKIAAPANVENALDNRLIASRQTNQNAGSNSAGKKVAAIPALRERD